MIALAYRFRRTATFALLLGLAACGGDAPTPPERPVPPDPPGPPPPALLPAGVHALAGVSPSLQDGDLEPLRALVGDARYVALGESTHGSEGYYQAKFRVMRFLVEQVGFRAIGLETPWLGALPASRYVESCEGTPEAAMRGFFVVWHSESIRDLLRWACEFNRTHPSDPIVFFGFDIQEPWLTAPAVQDFLDRAATGDAARGEPLRHCLGATAGSDQFYLSPTWREHEAGNRDADAHRACLDGIAALEAWITTNGAALADATSAAAVEEARIALVSLRASQESLWDPDPVRYEARDRAMAALLQRLQALHAPGERALIWAWNWHIARRYEEVRGFDDDPQAVVPRQGSRAMGSHLHDALGADYLPIALIGYDVEIPAFGTTPPIPTSPAAVEWRLQQLGPDPLLVDLRQPLPDTLLPPGRTYQISQEWGDPYRQFGALLFLEHSPSMRFAAVEGG